jgi:hypothetical protein
VCVCVRVCVCVCVCVCVTGISIVCQLLLSVVSNTRPYLESMSAATNSV